MTEKESSTPKNRKMRVASIIPDSKNARTHSEAQVEQIAASIKRFGFNNPILIDENNVIIAGHGRFLGAMKLGLKSLPVRVLSHMSEAEKRAYVLADNQIALNAGWDLNLVKFELLSLQVEDFDLSLTGFGEDFVADLLREETEGLTDDDDVPEAPKLPVVVLGDIWVLGNHRLMCGDSTSIDAVERLMDGGKADVLFTDPPYGIDFAPQRGTHGKILNDALAGSAFEDFLASVFFCADSVMKPNTYGFVWTGWSNIGAFEKAIQPFFKIQALHIWVKNNFGIGYYSRPKHEPFYLCLRGKPDRPVKAPADVWEFAKVHKTIHSCEKPVMLIESILDAYHKNGTVLDFFGGSGSTLIACEKTDRQCRMMELDPTYAQVILQRWADFTGRDPVREADGKAFSKIKRKKK